MRPAARRTLAGGLLAALALGVAAAPAQAEVELGVGSPTPTADGRRLQILVSADEGITPVDLDREVTVRLGPAAGELGPATQVIGTTPRDALRQTMLVLDTSGSMDDGDGSKFVAAKAAAQAFIDGVPKDVEVGLVTFGDPARVRVPLETDRERLRTTVKQLETAGDTALFEAVSLAAKRLSPRAASRNILLLTDGENEDKIAPKVEGAAVAELVKDLGIDVVGVNIGNSDPGEIVAVAGDRDRVLDASRVPQLQERLRRLFSAQADSNNKDLTVEVDLPPELVGTAVRLEVSGTVAGVPVSTDVIKTIGEPVSATTPPAAAAGPAGAYVPPATGPQITPQVLAIALVALFVAATVLVSSVAGAVSGGREHESEVVRRLSVYTFTGRDARRSVVAEQTTGLGSSTLARTAVGLADRLSSGKGIEKSLDARLDAAGLPLRTAEWTVLHAVLAVAGLLLLLLIGAGRPAAGLIGLVLGLVLPWLFLTFRKARRQSAFLSQLPDTLQLLAGSLKAGYSLPQAMDTVTREAQAPIKNEFNRALVEARLGMPPEDALEGIADRTRSRDFGWIVMAIRIQREVGGNLAELLTTVADTLRERERLRRQVTALSAEGRLSGIILGLLPVVFALYMLLVNPEYLDPLFSTPLGWLLVGAGAVMLVVGGFWMAKVVTVEV